MTLNEKPSLRNFDIERVLTKRVGPIEEKAAPIIRYEGKKDVIGLLADPTLIRNGTFFWGKELYIIAGVTYKINQENPDRSGRAYSEPPEISFTFEQFRDDLNFATQIMRERTERYLPIKLESVFEEIKIR